MKNSQFREKHGIALISVILIMAVVLVLSLTFSFVALSERRATSSSVQINETLQVADAVSERARLEVVGTFERASYTVSNFLKQVRDDQIVELSGVKSTTIDGIEGRWEIRGVSEPGSQYGWIDVAATAETAQGAQTVIRRVSFGQTQIFDLAMLSETTNCMYCHLRVRGDVGSLELLRPGWGSEGGGGKNSGNGSWVYGSVYAARNVSGDNTDLSGTPKIINGARVRDNVLTNYSGSKLPVDVDGDDIPDFPPIRRDIAQANALGSLGVNPVATDGALIYGIPNNNTLGSVPGSSNLLTGVNKTYDGNLILIGTSDNPINLDEDVYVSGDVVIKGVVTGIGAIYAGRNIYFAGDVSLKNPPDRPNQGVCAGITDPDDCAKENVRAGKDAFRTGARGNIVLGDYTEYDADGNPKPWYLRQSSDYYRAQFGFESNSDTRYYDKATGDELDYIDGSYKNVDGDSVSGSRVQAVNGYDAYDYSLRPGAIDSGGNFNSWLSDALYQQILGTKTYDYNSWRWNARGVSRQELRNQLAPLGVSAASADALFDNKDSRSLRDASGNIIGWARWNGGGTLRVIIDPPRTYENQVTRVDSFLYANQRIAGKTSMLGMAINGGMVAKEIGVLAPGRRRAWWMPSGRYGFLNNSAQTCGSSTPYYDPDVEACRLTVNYDHRLRNGGYGFNLVSGIIGQTLSWQLADDYSDRVR